MSEKRCFKCGTIKPLDQFYKHAQMGDGHLNKCTECTRKDVAEREAKLRSTDPEWLCRERERCREKQERRRAMGIKDDPAIRRKAGSAWYQRNKHKSNARIKANRAQERGVLIKPDACEACGASGIELEKHHPDYSRPIVVQWLCTKCHGLTRRLSTAAKAIAAAQQELFK